MRTTTRTLPALAALLFVAACGGGGDGDGLATEVAQGYAADAATMPVSTTDTVDAATTVLENALAATQTASADAQAQAVAQPQATGSASCLQGGSVEWTVTGPSSTLGNGQLDAGETYAVTYTHCVNDAGTEFNGTMQLAVTLRAPSAVDFTVTASNLQAVTAAATYLLNGNLTEQRSVATSGATSVVTGEVSSTGITLVTTRGTRQATYQLQSLDWQVVRTYVNGVLQTRTHQGSLSLSANTPRRPAASLAISTQGTLTISADGFANAGAFTVRTARDTITCTYANGTAVLSLDRGSDGTVDRQWTVTRPLFIDSAG